MYVFKHVGLATLWFFVISVIGGNAVILTGGWLVAATRIWIPLIGFVLAFVAFFAHLFWAWRRHLRQRGKAGPIARGWGRIILLGIGLFVVLLMVTTMIVEWTKLMGAAVVIKEITSLSANDVIDLVKLLGYSLGMIGTLWFFIYQGRQRRRALS